MCLYNSHKNMLLLNRSLEQFLSFKGWTVEQTPFVWTCTFRHYCVFFKTKPSTSQGNCIHLNWSKECSPQPFTKYCGDVFFKYPKYHVFLEYQLHLLSIRNENLCLSKNILQNLDLEKKTFFFCLKQ